MAFELKKFDNIQIKKTHISMYIVYEYVNVNWFSYWNILLRFVSGSHICLHYIVYIHMGIAESQ